MDFFTCLKHICFNFFFRHFFTRFLAGFICGWWLVDFLRGPVPAPPVFSLSSIIFFVVLCFVSAILLAFTLKALYFYIVLGLSPSVKSPLNYGYFVPLSLTKRDIFCRLAFQQTDFFYSMVFDLPILYQWTVPSLHNRLLLAIAQFSLSVVVLFLHIFPLFGFDPLLAEFHWANAYVVCGFELMHRLPVLFGAVGLTYILTGLAYGLIIPLFVGLAFHALENIWICTKLYRVLEEYPLDSPEFDDRKFTDLEDRHLLTLPWHSKSAEDILSSLYQSFQTYFSQLGKRFKDNIFDIFWAIVFFLIFLIWVGFFLCYFNSLDLSHWPPYTLLPAFLLGVGGGLVECFVFLNKYGKLIPPRIFPGCYPEDIFSPRWLSNSWVSLGSVPSDKSSFKESFLFALMVHRTVIYAVTIPFMLMVLDGGFGFDTLVEEAYISANSTFHAHAFQGYPLLEFVWDSYCRILCELTDSSVNFIRGWLLSFALVTYRISFLSWIGEHYFEKVKKNLFFS